MPAGLAFLVITGLVPAHAPLDLGAGLVPGLAFVVIDRTSAELAQHVLSHGFTGVDFIGDVLLADSPANAEKNVTGCAIIEVTIDHARRLTPYEHTPEDQWFRRWLVPAYLINNHGQVRLLTDDDAHDAYIEARSRAEDATAEMFSLEAQQEAADALEEAEQSIDLDDLLANGQV
jgi:hypothetical protein